MYIYINIQKVEKAHIIILICVYTICYFNVNKINIILFIILFHFIITNACTVYIHILLLLHILNDDDADDCTVYILSLSIRPFRPASSPVRLSANMLRRKLKIEWCEKRNFPETQENVIILQSIYFLSYICAYKLYIHVVTKCVLPSLCTAPASPPLPAYIPTACIGRFSAI